MINWNEERKVIKTRQEVVDEIKEILIDSLMLEIDKDLIMNGIDYNEVIIAGNINVIKDINELIVTV